MLKAGFLTARFLFLHKIFTSKKDRKKAHTHLTTNRDILSTTCTTPDIAAATALGEVTAAVITAGEREGIYWGSLPSQGRHWGSSTHPRAGGFWI